MKVIKANLPVVGNTSIHFRGKSEDLINFSDMNEMERLDKIPHLGLAKAAFTGSNHTRLEYTLLQCAIVEIASKLHKDDHDISLSNTVKLDGNIARASSGEELLKSWFLLSAFGHCQWTHGTERSILQKAHDDKDFINWLLEGFRLTDLKNWCRDTINNYDTYSFHYVISIRRITLGDPYDRRKTKFLHYLRNLLLKPGILFAEDNEYRNKLLKIRYYFKIIRLLSISALDSHYSHTPIEINVQSAINDPNTFSRNIQGVNKFGEKLKQIAGMLAEDLYLSKKCTSIQRSYEIEYKNKVESQFINNRGNRLSERNILKTGSIKVWEHQPTNT